MATQEYCNKELDTLKSVGDRVILNGNVNHMRVCVSRYQAKSNLIFATKSIKNKLHVIVMESKG